MADENKDVLDFTGNARNLMNDTVNDGQFEEKDAQLIYDTLKNRLRLISFGDYLKRYIYEKAELEGDYQSIPLNDYQDIIRDSFRDNNTKASFSPTTAKLSALSKNWLTQLTVKRNVVFLLGFGLRMSTEDVNMFLEKCLREFGINPKNPFEVICWYCYKNGFNYVKYEQLMKQYEVTPASEEEAKNIFDELTVNVRESMLGVHDDESLIHYLSRLKTKDNLSRMSVSAKKEFDALYDKARDMVANIYNEMQTEEFEDELAEYRDKVLRNERLFDYERLQLLDKFSEKKRKFFRDDITESDLEQIICSAIPKDRHGNLTPSKASKLNDQFSGKRFSRQRMSEIRAGNTEITRFDLITLSFFIVSQCIKEYPDKKKRYLWFVKNTNDILRRCSMGDLLVSNPYECFVQMCVLSDEPLSTYADVWELSYDS